MKIRLFGTNLPWRTQASNIQVWLYLHNSTFRPLVFFVHCQVAIWSDICVIYAFSYASDTTLLICKKKNFLNLRFVKQLLSSKTAVAQHCASRRVGKCAQTDVLTYGARLTRPFFPHGTHAWNSLSNFDNACLDHDSG